MAVYDPHDLGQNISKLVHTRGFLTHIPGNLCQISDLVEVDLSWNKIMTLENINCMERLDTLILRNNLVTYLSNSTLLGMTELRILDLSDNVLTVIEPNTISDPSLGMLHIIFKDNSLTSVDITNVVIDTPFCTADFSNNAIKELVNDIGWIVVTTVTAVSSIYRTTILCRFQILKTWDSVIFGNWVRYLILDSISRMPISRVTAKCSPFSSYPRIS